MKANSVINELKLHSSPKKAEKAMYFSKTGKGEYAEHDVFIGVTVPEQRKIAKQFSALPLSEISKLLTNKIHEYRLTALFILVTQFEKGTERTKKEVVDFYLSHLDHVNNWDLVDSSAHKIVGEYLLYRPKKEVGELMLQLSVSKNMWHNRVGILLTFPFIKSGDMRQIGWIATRMIEHPHDLIHKATGWLLREAGKVNLEFLESFLQKYATRMPRTMLRYSIEKFPETKRKKYLKMK